jgi:hypothetical protein
MLQGNHKENLYQGQTMNKLERRDEFFKGVVTGMIGAVVK